MIFQATPIAGVLEVHPERREDSRGYFVRTFCAQEFVEAGLVSRFLQSSTSYNRLPGTLRGMHYQGTPHPEVKLVRCSRGRVFDAVVDLRRDSGTFGRVHARELSAENGVALYVPAGVAHGFLTLEADSEVFYSIDSVHVPGAGEGIRWNDPGLGVDWPRVPAVVSERDLRYPDFEW